ncbi:MAG: hypothetical protein OXG39_12225 [Chloroflexi bacterium]|nr:hypothetical protein [Chloroflexota bacterium]
MLGRIVKLVEAELGASARSVLPGVLSAVEAVLKEAERGGVVSFSNLVDRLETALGAAGRNLAARIVAELVAHLGPGPVDPRDDGSVKWSPTDALKKLEKSALSAINHAKDGAVGAVDAAETAATQSVKAAGSVAEQGVEAAGAAAIRDVKAVWHDVESGLFGALARQGLNAAVTVARAAAPSALKVTLGPVSVQLVNIPTAIGLLEAAAKSPPRDRASLLTFVSGLSSAGLVSGVSLTGSVALAALVVESDSLSVGFEAEWDAQGFLARFDALMDAIGLH